MQEQIYPIRRWVYEECKIKSKTSHNCGNLYKLMNRRVNTKHFLKTEKFF